MVDGVHELVQFARLAFDLFLDRLDQRVAANDFLGPFARLVLVLQGERLAQLVELVDLLQLAGEPPQLGRSEVRFLGGPFQLLFQVENLPVEVRQALDDHVHGRRVQVDFLQQRHNRFAVALQPLLVGDAVALAHLAHAQRAHVAQDAVFEVAQARHRFQQVVDVRFFVDLQRLAFFVFEVLDHLAQFHLAAFQLLLNFADDLRRVRHAHHRFEDFLVALLDPLGDFDFALAGQQADGAHLAQVHAHRVVGLADRTRVDNFLFLFLLLPVELHAVFFLAVHDLDVQVVEHDQHVVDLFRTEQVGGQPRIHLVVGEEAAVLAERDQFFEFFDFFFFGHLQSSKRKTNVTCSTDSARRSRAVSTHRRAPRRPRFRPARSAP